MLNRAEFAQLQSTLLSHMARTLYVFYIQPKARSGQTTVDPIEMTKQLISISSYAPCNPSLNDVEHALLELEQLNLIKRAPGTISWQGAAVILPLFVMETNFVPTKSFQMFPSWQPSASYPTVALQAGLIDYHYQDQELQSFISFWITRTLSRNQQAWERSFVMRLLKVRAAQTVKAYDRNYNKNNNFAGYSSSTQPNAYVPNPLAYEQSTPADTNPNYEYYSSNDIPSSIFNSDYEQVAPIWPNPFNDAQIPDNVPYNPSMTQKGARWGSSKPNFAQHKQNIPERNHAQAQYAYPISEAKLRDLERREREYLQKRNQIDYSARSEATKIQVAQMLAPQNSYKPSPEANAHANANLPPIAEPYYKDKDQATAPAPAPAPAPASALALASAMAPVPAAAAAATASTTAVENANTKAASEAATVATSQVVPANQVQEAYQGEHSNADYSSRDSQSCEQHLEMIPEQSSYPGNKQEATRASAQNTQANNDDINHQIVSSEHSGAWNQEQANSEENRTQAKIGTLSNNRSGSSFDTGGGVNMQELYARCDSVYTQHNDPKSRVNKPTLFALATGKEEFESIAPGYTDPLVQEQKRQLATGQAQALYTGYEPLTIAKDYTPSKVNDNFNEMSSNSAILNEPSSAASLDISAGATDAAGADGAAGATVAAGIAIATVASGAADTTGAAGAAGAANSETITALEAGLLTTAEAMEKAFFGSSARTLSSNEQKQELGQGQGQGLASGHEDNNLSESAAYWCSAEDNLASDIANDGACEPISTPQEQFGRTLDGNFDNIEPNGALEQHTDTAWPDASVESIELNRPMAPMEPISPTGLANTDTENKAQLSGFTGASWAQDDTDSNQPSWDDSWSLSEPSVEERATQGFDKSFLAELSAEFKKH